MDSLFENIGEKIKTLAKVIFSIGIAVFALTGFIVFVGLVGAIGFVVFLMGVGIIAVGIISSYISSMFLYGFGELISNSKKFVENGCSPQAGNAAPASESKPEPTALRFSKTARRINPQQKVLWKQKQNRVPTNGNAPIAARSTKAMLALAAATD